MLTTDKLTSIEVTMPKKSILQRVWHAITEHLPFRTARSVPFWDLHIILLFSRFSLQICLCTFSVLLSTQKDCDRISLKKILRQLYTET